MRKNIWKFFTDFYVKDLWYRNLISIIENRPEYGFIHTKVVLDQIPNIFF